MPRTLVAEYFYVVISTSTSTSSSLSLIIGWCYSYRIAQAAEFKTPRTHVLEAEVSYNLTY